MKLLRRFVLALMVVGFGGASALSADRRSEEGGTRIYFLDVGEGAATLVDSPDLGRILIDTGNPTSKIVTLLKRHGHGAIDTLILTHPHPDHIGGVYSVLEFLTPKAIYDNGETLSMQEPDQRWYQEKVRVDDRYRSMKAGDEITNGKSSLTALSPTTLDGDWNSNSLVLRLIVGDHTVLLMADANFKSEERLLQESEKLKADIIQVGHHGSNQASSPEFIKAVAAKYAIFSSDKDNINGYPASTTLDNFKTNSAKALTTYKEGTIIFELTPNKPIARF